MSNDATKDYARYERHRKRCEAECTHDVIFLFQRKIWTRIGLPDGYDTDGESIWRRDDNTDEDAPESLDWKEVYEMESADGMPYAIYRWETEGVWLDRDEAEAYGRAKHHNYTDGWRVFGMPAYGELARMLRGET